MTQTLSLPPREDAVATGQPGVAVGIVNVRKSYGAVEVLSAMDIDIRAGEFITLLGPSGSGKTTLLNIIAGMLTPDQGRVMFGNQDMTHVSPHRRNIGMVFQNYALMPHMTVAENVAFPLRARGVPKAEIGRLVEDALKLVELTGLAPRYPRQLSGGQQQRVALARSFVYRPPIILMDEPLGALDKRLRDQMQTEIKRLHAQSGVTIIYVTHDQDEAMSMSDRVVLMNQGAVEQIDTPRDLYFRPRTLFAAEFLGHSNVLEGRATEKAGRASTDRGETLRYSGIAIPGDRVVLLVRPESIIVDHSAPADLATVLEGTIDNVSLLGGITRYGIRSDHGLYVSALMTSCSAGRFNIGDRVFFGWHAADAQLLPH